MITEEDIEYFKANGEFRDKGEHFCILNFVITEKEDGMQIESLISGEEKLSIKGQRIMLHLLKGYRELTSYMQAKCPSEPE